MQAKWIAYATKTAIVVGAINVTSAATARNSLSISNVDNTADLDKPISTATQAALDTKANLVSDGIILVSPNDTQYRVSVDDNGTRTTEVIA